MRILVTGGAGFIGSNFVTRTLETQAGQEITVLDSLTYAGSSSNLGSHLSSVQFIQGDIRDTELVTELVSKSDLVVHFAAESHNDNSLENPNLFYETNIMGTLNISNACVRHDVRLHHISTDEVFGDLPLESTESFSLATPYNPSSPYSASKAAADHLIRAWVRSFGLRATISNSSNNYGPRQHREKLIPNTIKKLLSGERAEVYGAGLNVRDWIHVDDHVDGIWLAIEKGVIGNTYLFGVGDTLTNLSVVTSIIRELNMPDDFIKYVKDRPGHDLRYSIDASASIRELDWQPSHYSLISNLPDLLTWYR